jgi:hypothetical protein
MTRQELSRSSSYLDRERAPTAPELSRTMLSKPPSCKAAAESPAGPAPTTIASWTPPSWLFAPTAAIVADDP